MTTPMPPAIFLAFANEREDGVNYLRNLPAEARELQSALDVARRAGLCELVVRQGANTNDILSVFQSEEYRNRIEIFHYAGHSNGYQLLLDGGERLHGEGFATFLGQQRALQLVFLNGCATEGHVRHLLSAGIASVIATSQRIDDAVATDFARRFYRALASGASVESAFAEAEGAVLSTRGNGPRALYWGGEETGTDRYPWVLHVRDGAESVGNWSLPEAAGDPLFGLPALPELDLPEKPFRHLNWFARKHARVFFGRSYQIRELYERVTAHGAAPIVLLYGQSGVGKSSLLDAGLHPRLEVTHTVRYAKRDPTLGLLGTLRSLLETENSLHAAWQTLEAEEERPLVVIVDQVEEAFTKPALVHTDEVTAFFEALDTIFGIPSDRPQGKLILGFRKEWLLEVEQRLRERQLPWAKVALERLDRRGILEAVEGPTRGERLVQQYGLTVQAGLAERIADNLLEDPSTPIAPILQILLTRMWAEATHKNAAHPVFDESLYQTLKREGLLLGDFLDRELEALRNWRAELVDSGLVLDVLALHTNALGTSDQWTTAKLATAYHHRAADLPALLRRCCDRYLLVEPESKEKETEPATRLSHDTLALLVRKRFEISDLPGQRARRILESRATDWANGNTGTVLDDADLAVVEHGAAGMRAPTNDEARLVATSCEERDRRKHWRNIWRAVGLFAVVIIAFTAVIATWQWQKAERQTRIALSRALATSAQAVATTKPQRALLLAVEAVRRPLEGNGVLLGGETVLRDILVATGGLPLRGHKGPVSALSFDTQGRWLATGSEDGTARLWDLAHPEADPHVLRANEGPVTAVAFDPQRRWLATGSRAGATRLWDLAYPYAKPRVLQNGKGVLDLAFDPQGRWIATGGWDWTARLWNLGDPEATPQGLAGHANAVTTLAFDPKGRWLATGGNDSTVQLWDLVHPGAVPRALLKGHSVGRVAFDPKGRWLAIATIQGAGWLWDLSRPEDEPRALLGNARGVQALAFDPKGQWFATSDLNQIRLWKVAEIEAEPSTLLESKGVTTLAIDPQGHWLAMGALNGVVQLLDLNHPETEPRVLRGHEDGVTTLAFDPQGRWLATGSRDATARLWDLNQLATEPRVLRRYAVPVTTFAFDPLGRWLATGSVDKTARLWDLVHPDTEPRILRGHGNGLLTLAFSPKGHWLATGSADTTARLWDLAHQDAEPLVLSGHEDWVTTLAFDARECWLATGSRDGTARLWDLAHPDSDPRVLTGHGGPVKRLAFDPKGRYLVTSGDYDVQGRWRGSNIEEVNTLIWDLGHPKADPHLLRGHKGIPTALVFDPLGRWLATGGHDHAQLWNTTNPQTEPRMLPEYKGPVTALAVDPLGRWLAIGSVEGTEATVKMLDFANPDAPPRMLPGHDKLVDALAFDAEGRWLATGSRDGTVRLWDLAHSDAESRVLHGPGGSIRNLAFDPQGRWLATGSNDNTVRLWQLDIRALLQLACQTAGRNLSRKEWNQYLGELEYRKTCSEFPLPNEERNSGAE